MTDVENGTVLCFDVGLARTGVAIGNTLTRTARPLEIIHAQTNDARWKAVDRLVREWAPVYVVVGLPMHADGTPSTLTARCERFARQLGGRYLRAAYLENERGTSKAVERGREYIDDAAAALILQQFFDKRPEE